MHEIGIVGAKNSGKTTLVTGLIRSLTAKGYHVASIKHTGHAHTFDTVGKDSWQHRQAGAGVTLAVSAVETALYTHADSNLLEALRSVMKQHFDWCLIEGDKSSGRPKVLLTDNIQSLRGSVPANVIATYGTGPITGTVPHFYRDETSGLITFLLETYGPPVDGASA